MVIVDGQHLTRNSLGQLKGFRTWMGLEQKLNAQNAEVTWGTYLKARVLLAKTQDTVLTLYLFVLFRDLLNDYLWWGRRDSNPHAHWAHDPKSCPSASSGTSPTDHYITSAPAKHAISSLSELAPLAPIPPTSSPFSKIGTAPCQNVKSPPDFETSEA